MLNKSSNVSCSIVDVMQNLKRGFKKCRFTNGVLEPCKYHKDRANSVICGVFDEGGCPVALLEDNVYQNKLLRSPQIDDLLQRLATEANVVGSWWLIKEQRGWLHRRLVKILSNTVGDCRILVSGVASYAHFYSYLHILFDAAKESGFSLDNLYIDVCDACITPLLEICYIENDIRSNNKFSFNSFKQKYNILGFEFLLPRTNYEFIKKMVNDIRKCHISVYHCNIFHLEDHSILMRDNYNIITEHFLLSMFENAEELIGLCRKNYASIMKNNGHLLIATGYENKNSITRLLEIHQGYGLETNPREIELVWDPFGISSSELLDILSRNNNQSYVAVDNCMIDFVYKKC